LVSRGCKEYLLYNVDRPVDKIEVQIVELQIVSGGLIMFLERRFENA